MLSVHSRSISHESHLKGAIWTVDDPRAWTQDISMGSATEVAVDGRSRMLSSRLLRMAGVFALDIHKRAEQRQDCAVFALACESGDPFADAMFNKPGGLKVVTDITPIEGVSLANADEIVASHMRAGEIVITSSLRDPARFDNSITHYLVKASVDEEQALYLSKFSATGPALANS